MIGTIIGIILGIIGIEIALIMLFWSTLGFFGLIIIPIMSVFVIGIAWQLFKIVITGLKWVWAKIAFAIPQKIK